MPRVEGVKQRPAEQDADVVVTGADFAGLYMLHRLGDRTYKLCSDTTSEYGRYVKSLGGSPWWGLFAVMPLE